MGHSVVFCYVAAKATYIRLILAKWGFFGPSSVTRGRTHIVLRWNMSGASTSTYPENLGSGGQLPAELRGRVCLFRPPGTTVPDGLMFYPWCFFSLFRHSFSEIPQPIAPKLCHMIGIWLNFFNPTPKILGGGGPSKNYGGQKRAKFRSILDHFRLWSRISPERLKISKISRRYKLWQFLLRLTKKVWWTLVH